MSLNSPVEYEEILNSLENTSDWHVDMLWIGWVHKTCLFEHWKGMQRASINQNCGPL
jgi:hypothetical protein